VLYTRVKRVDYLFTCLPLYLLTESCKATINALGLSKQVEIKHICGPSLCGSGSMAQIQSIKRDSIEEEI